MKKTVLILCLLGATASMVLILNNQTGICKTDETTCFSHLRSIGTTLFIFVPIFVFSIIAAFFKPAVFKSWAIFSVIWAVLTILGVYFLVLGGSGGGVGVYADPGPGFVALFLFGLYPIVSIAILIWKSWKLRGK